MNLDGKRLFELLPAIYRIRDAEQGNQLAALLEVIADEFGVLEEDIAQLYDDQFIETCAPWAVPYIGDLIGYRPLHTTTPGMDNGRAEVAHTITFRRRKGTAAMLEQLARDVTGWNARAVEFFQNLAWTQNMNHLRPQSKTTLDLRAYEALERVNGAFDTASHLIDVRHVEQGAKYNISDVGIFLWRLDVFSLRESPAVPVTPGNAQQFFFNPLGLSQPLFTRPFPEPQIEHLADPINVPEPISRRVMDKSLLSYYGADHNKSIDIIGVEAKSICVCDLSDTLSGDWAHIPASGKVAIDPVLGRLAFGDPQTAPPKVTFHYGFGVRIGGGDYDRSDEFMATDLVVARVPTSTLDIQDALNLAANGGVVEITDNGRYAEALTINASSDQAVHLRAANEFRPTVLLSAPLEISSAVRGTVVLSGLVIAGGPILVSAAAGNKLSRLKIVNCTLVPTAGPSLIVDLPDVEIEIERSIVGGLRVAEGSSLRVSDSIVDGLAEQAIATCAPTGDGKTPAGAFTVSNSTIIGKVHVMELSATNSIFFADLAENDAWLKPDMPGAALRAAKKQAGCVRFSYVPLASIVPRRHHCVPSSKADSFRMRPQFTSLKYGDPGYGQLSLASPLEICKGADDESEIGAFHMVYQPQREANLRIRLQEYLRLGLEAGIYYVN
jgi:hypothetical protein